MIFVKQNFQHNRFFQTRITSIIYNMAIRRITKYGEDILRRKTKPVRFSDIKDKLPHILKDMWDSCFAVKGVGLSANQIGLDLRLAIIIITENEKEKRFVIINPEIAAKTAPVMEIEGCLSVPGVYGKVKRFDKVKVHALNEKGMPVEINAQGLLARVLQHETDHLDGKLFINRMSPIARIKVKSYIKKAKSHWCRVDESKGIFYEGPVFGNT
jgi:peptide deformylase